MILLRNQNMTQTAARMPRSKPRGRARKRNERAFSTCAASKGMTLLLRPNFRVPTPLNFETGGQAIDDPNRRRIGPEAIRESGVGGAGHTCCGPSPSNPV